MGKHADSAELPVEKKNAESPDSLNLLGLTEKGVGTPGNIAGKTEISNLSGHGKPLPGVDLYDSGANKDAVSKSEAPKYDGTTSWAALEGYTLATKPNPQDENRDAVNKSETPKFKGSTSWAALEDYTLATGKTKSADDGAAKPPNKDDSKPQ